MGAISRNEDGSRVLTTSIREDLEHRHNLTIPEAERLFHMVEAGEDEATSALSIKNERKVFRVHVERGYSPDADPEVVRERRRVADEQEHLAEGTEDKHAPEAGPYGPNATYTTTGTVTRASDLPR